MALKKINKIPVRIVQTQDMHGTKKVSVMIDVGNYLDTGGNPEIKLKKFKKLYFDTVKTAKKIFYGTSGQEEMPGSLSQGFVADDRQASASRLASAISAALMRCAISSRLARPLSLPCVAARLYQMWAWTRSGGTPRPV